MIQVSVLFNEPKLLKCCRASSASRSSDASFSALQRAEIAEIDVERVAAEIQPGFSALQRAEIAEISDFCEEGFCGA